MMRTRHAAAALALLASALLGVSVAKGTPIDELYVHYRLGHGPTPAICNTTSCNFFFLCNEASDPGDPTTSTGTHCGEVDARPAIPAILFRPENRPTLQVQPDVVRRPARTDELARRQRRPIPYPPPPPQLTARVHRVLLQP